MTASVRPLPSPAAPPLRVVIGPHSRSAPQLRGWVLLTLAVLAAFFLLIYSRIALDRSAFVLEEIERQMRVEEARYWELRLEAAELQSPERVVQLAGEMGMVYPTTLQTVEVPGMGTPGAEAGGRWVDLKALLSAQP